MRLAAAAQLAAQFEECDDATTPIGVSGSVVSDVLARFDSAVCAADARRDARVSPEKGGSAPVGGPGSPTGRGRGLDSPTHRAFSGSKAVLGRFDPAMFDTVCVRRGWGGGAGVPQ